MLLRAMEFESLIVAFRGKWLKECISQPQSIWYHIPNKIFNKVRGIDFLLKCDFEMSKIPVKLSDFHKQALLYGKMIFTHNFSPHISLLWNSRVITINRKSIFKAEWYDKGLTFVYDLLNSDRLLLCFDEFTSK